MTIRIGLLGASKISRGAVLEPASSMSGVEVTCVAARDPDRAREFAQTHGIPAVEADYRALVNSDAVDLVYNALPPAGHAEWSIAALRAGKHVLCEKPFALNAAEARLMVEAAGERHLIEAFHYRFHPAFLQLLEIIDAGEIGAIQSLEGRLAGRIYFAPGELRYEPAQGGGALMDLGCYVVHWLRTVTGHEPRVVSASSRLHATGVDVETEAMLEVPGGIPATLYCSMDETRPEGLDAEVSVTGERGSVRMVNPLLPHVGHNIVVNVDGDTREFDVDGRTTYWHQLEHVIALLSGNTPEVLDGADAIANMQVIDDIRRRAEIPVPA